MIQKIDNINLLDSMLANEPLESLEKKMITHKQVECGVIHRFGPGIYIREVNIPSDTLAIGHHQNFEHMNVLLKGRVTISNSDGTTSELKAPMLFTGKPGRKVGYIHEEMVWLNIYSTEEKDIEKLEAKFLTKNELFSEAVKASAKLISNQLDQKDFDEVLRKTGFTSEQVREMSENKTDLTDLPYGNYKVKTGPSTIEGKGLFATSKIESGEVICPARINGKRTIAGRYTNHSATPNAEMQAGVDCEIQLVAIRQIEGCRGGLDGEEITIDYMAALNLTQSLGGGFKCQP